MQLWYFSHGNAREVTFESRGKNFVDEVMKSNYEVITLFQNNFISRRPKVTDIIKIAMILIKTTYKDLKKVKKNVLVKSIWL